MRFGCFLPQTVDSSDLKELKRIARRCEELRFSSIWLFDHMTTFPVVTGKPFLECWTTLSALTQCTRKIRLGPLVSCNSFRHPPLLAKMAATVDVLSGGRLEFGIGAGWFKDEYRRFGYNYPSLGERIRQLEESLKIITGVWIQERFSFNGSYYRVSDAFCTPKPVQKPHPPIWIGGKGDNTLRLVAGYGDACNLSSLSPEECMKRLMVLENYCEDWGRDPRSIIKSYMAIIFLDKDLESAKAKIRRYLEALPTKAVSEIDESFYSKRIVGGPGECIRRIEEYEKAGIGYIILFFPDISDGMLTRFSEDVASHF
ncbi:MAG: TIGR03560 family F420-dependent LLM class oxidoreductase [Candidatus Bathyarchaeia archaeon]